MMATPVQRLDLMLRDFDARTSDGRVHPGAILRDVIDRSPDLKFRILESIEKGYLDSFQPLPPNSGAGGTYASSARSIQLPMDKIVAALTDKRTQAEIVFVLGHEIQHSFNLGFGAQTQESLNNKVASIAQGPSPHDYTSVVGSYIAGFRTNEASAHIGGFNAVVSSVHSRNPAATLGDIYNQNPHRMRDFIDVTGGSANVRYALKPGLAVDDKMHMPASDRNIALMSTYFFDKAQVHGRGLGSHRDQNYREYYASAALKRILQIENWAHTNAIARDPTHPRALVQLDTAALGVNPAALHTGTFFQDLSHARTPAGGVQAAPLPTSRSTALQGAALPIAEASIPRTDAPLFSQAVAALDRLGPRSGITSHEELSAVAAAMAVRAQHDGLTRIDLVVGSADGRRLFAVEGNPASPDSRRSDIDRIHAASQPVEANLARLQSVDTAPTAVEHTHQHGQGKSR